MSEATDGRFHWRDGWHFTRLDGGAVRIEHRKPSPADAEEYPAFAMIDPASWASIIAHVSADPNQFAAAERFHAALAESPRVSEAGLGRCPGPRLLLRPAGDMTPAQFAAMEKGLGVRLVFCQHGHQGAHPTEPSR
jgi:hypothetical protein